MEPQLDLDLLRTFIAAAEGMSFAKAAAAVRRSPPAISMQIQRLEAQLGKKLFERDTRNIALTGAGETLLSHARRILRLHDEAVAAIRRPEVAGRVIIGAPDDYVSSLLPPALKAFSARFPRVEIEVVCAQSTVLGPMLAADEIDLAFVTRMRGVSGDFIRLEPMVWVADAVSEIWMRRPVPIALYEPRSVARIHALKALDAAGIAYRARYTSPSLLGLIAVVEAGLAVAALAACSAPSEALILGAAHGLPAPAPLEILLSRSAASRRPPCDALAETIAEVVGRQRG
jgi:DNA-binding transcriptional LysR family regulator